MRRRAATTALLLALCAGPLVAQQDTTRVTARLVDEQGQALAGVSIVVGEEHELWSDAAKPLAQSGADGRLVIDVPEDGHVPAGSFSIRYALFRRAGYSSARVPLSTGRSIYTPWGYYQAQAGGYRDLGDVVLLPAGTLKGLVRGAGGRPVQGARVAATDLLSSGYYAQSNNPYNPVRPLYCGEAVTDARGRFTLDGVFADGVALTIRAPGHYDLEVPFASEAQAIDLSLEPSGFVSGKVVDTDGKPVDALLYVAFEGQHYSSVFGATQPRTGADGSFKLSLQHRGRYTVRANAVLRPGEPYRGVSSAILSGPRVELDLELGAAAQSRPIRVKVVAKGTGKPVAGARACVLWQEPSYVNARALESVFEQLARPVDAGGVVELPGPAAQQPPKAGLLVKAKGYAPLVRTAIDYDPDKPLELEVAMVDGGVVEGRVVDDRTGEPIAGAEVSVTCASAQGYNPYYSGAPPASLRVRSGPDGRYRLDSLPAELVEIVVRAPGRPDSKVSRVTLGASEVRRGVELRSPTGVSLEGRVFAGFDADGEKRAPKLLEGRWTVRVGQHQQSGMRYSSSIMFDTSEFVPGSGASNGGGVATLDAGGRFRVAGIGRGRYRFYLVAPPLGKRGRELQTAIEPLRVRDKDIVRDFDVAEDLSGIVRGKVVLTGAKVEMSRLFVLSRARSKTAVTSGRVHFDANSLRCVVAADGTFAFRAPAGPQDIWLMDAVGATVLYRHPAPVDVRGGEASQVTLEVPLTLLRLRLQPRDPAAGICASSLEWVVTHPGEPEDTNFLRNSRGYGVAVQGCREFVLTVPPAPLDIALRSTLSGVDPQGGHGNTALASARIQPELGRLNTLELKVDPPAAVSTPQGDEKTGKAVPAGRR